MMYDAETKATILQAKVDELENQLAHFKNVARGLFDAQRLAETRLAEMQASKAIPVIITSVSATKIRSDGIEPYKEHLIPYGYTPTAYGSPFEHSGKVLVDKEACIMIHSIEELNVIRKTIGGHSLVLTSTKHAYFSPNAEDEAKIGVIIADYAPKNGDLSVGGIIL